MLSGVGGLLGVAVGFAIPRIIIFFIPDQKAIVTGSSVMLAFGISVAIGILFGIYPAQPCGPDGPDRSAATRVRFSTGSRREETIRETLRHRRGPSVLGLERLPEAIARHSRPLGFLPWACVATAETRLD